MSAERSPLDAVHRNLGARMVQFGGWEMPLEYHGGTISEHLACRTGAVVFDVSHLGTVRVEGPDAFDRLQRTLTNDLDKIEPGRAQYTHLLDDDASVLDDLIVWWRPDGDGQSFDVMPNASNTDRVTRAVGGHDTTATRAVLAVQGPDAVTLAATVIDGVESLGRFRVGIYSYEDVPLTVAGTGYTGEPGIEIAVPVDASERLWNAITTAGVTPAGLGARDTLRLEAALPLHGHELGPGITPLQAGLSWVVGWKKPSFRGREALEAERDRGVARQLAGISTEGRRPPRAECAVTIVADPSIRGGSAAAGTGVVSSGNFSPTLGHGIALAFLPPGVDEGTQVTIDVRGTALPGTVVATPFLVAAASRRR